MAKENVFEVFESAMKEELRVLEVKERETGKDGYYERRGIICQAKVLTDTVEDWVYELKEHCDWDAYINDSELMRIKVRLYNGKFDSHNFNDLPNHAKKTLLVDLVGCSFSNEEWYEVVSTKYDHTCSILSSEGYDSKTIDLIMEETFLESDPCQVHDKCIKPEFK